jgi:putative exosortase-associated protein (TIGR04073 family)
MGKCVIILVIGLLCFGFISAAYANDPGTKLTRGVANSLSGLLEVPQTIGEEWKASNNMAIGMFAGFGKGLVWAVGRTFSGFWDVLTFPFDIPKNYDSLVKPDYVWRTEPVHLIVDEPAAPGKPVVPQHKLK